MTLEPIGLLHSCFGEKFAIPRQPGLCPDSWGSLELLPKFRSLEAVRGLEGFSHVWLVFGFHQTSNLGWHPTVRPPRLGGNERVGVFASRSTFRPNPIGLSLVKLERIDTTTSHAPILHFGGVDLVHLTPIYDIKPYLPYAESIPDASHGFAPPPIASLDVQIHPDVLAKFESLPPRAQRVMIRCLALDPRPATQAHRTEKTYGANLCGHDIQFHMQQDTCIVTQISPIASG